MKMNAFSDILYSLLIILSVFLYTLGQYAVNTPKYNQLIAAGTSELINQIEHNNDVRFYFNPSSYLKNSSYYTTDYPLPQYYHIRILMDPCRYNAFNCCVNIFGAPEYAALIAPNLESERVYKPYVLASDVEVMKNYQFITEDLAVMPTSAVRSADDYAIFDERCIAYNDPYKNCSGRNWAYQRSPQRPPCMDNNYSLNALNGCYYPNGTQHEYCVQIGYSQNAFIGQCKDFSDPHCGTFLEVHMPNGSPYYSEDTVISDVRIETITESLSGVNTTAISLVFMGNSSRVLCAYTESFLREGTSVYIESTAPTCCCPAAYSSVTRNGSLVCPKGPTGDGAFAYKFKTISDAITVDPLILEFPYCPTDLNGNDSFLCTLYDTLNQRSYVTNCSSVYQQYNEVLYSYTSDNLVGQSYGGICPYYDACALTQQDGTCNSKDLPYTFIGRVGIVTSLTTIEGINMVWVSFNDGRTSYLFDESVIKIDTITKSMYEIWYVLRTPSNFVLNKRKGFNVTSPACTFDTTNNRYFPFAEINGTGVPIASSIS